MLSQDRPAEPSSGGSSRGGTNLGWGWVEGIELEEDALEGTGVGSNEEFDDPASFSKMHVTQNAETAEDNVAKITMEAHNPLETTASVNNTRSDDILLEGGGRDEIIAPIADNWGIDSSGFGSVSNGTSSSAFSPSRQLQSHSGLFSPSSPIMSISTHTEAPQVTSDSPQPQQQKKTSE